MAGTGGIVTVLRWPGRAVAARRLPLVALAALLSAGAWRFNADNTFTGLGLICWLGSIAAWAAVSLPGRPALPRGWRGWSGSVFVRPHSVRALWPFAMLAVITIGGAALRLWGLDDYPP